MIRSGIFAMFLAGGSGIACYRAAGSSLDLFIGGFFFAAILAGQVPGSLGSISGISIGMTASWLIPVHARVVTLQQWASCSVVLCSFISWISLTSTVVRRFLPSIGSTLVTIAALAWLSWPVWLSASPPLGLIRFHSLLAVNHVLINLGIWTEQPGAYRLISLGQDTAYQLPDSAWPAIGMQSAVALLCFNFKRRWSLSR